MSATGCDQSISLFSVKSCSGTFVHVERELCWVIFKMPSMVRANFPFTYFSAFCASASESNAPIDKNVSVCPIKGSPIKGVLSTSPIAPVPFASGSMTFHFSKLSGVAKNCRSIHLYSRLPFTKPSSFTASVF